MPNQNRNAIELLKGDHREVESLFAQLKSESSGERQLELGRAICVGLMVHAQIEEELFYPAARKALPTQGKDLVAEAAVEHASLKRLIADIDGSASGDELFDARFKVLEEYVRHHVKEEEDELMPAVERSEVDLEGLGDQLAERKEELDRKMESSRSSSGRRERKIVLPKPPRARRTAATAPSTAPGRKSTSVPARKKSSTATRASKRPARKTAATKGSARKRARTIRARATRG